jgi:hypothetical protein
MGPRLSEKLCIYSKNAEVSSLGVKSYISICDNRYVLHKAHVLVGSKIRSYSEIPGCVIFWTPEKVKTLVPGGSLCWNF